MANDPKNRFSRNGEDKPTAKADTKEMPLNERLKRVRAPGVVQTEIDGVPRSVWGTTDQIVEKPEPQPKWRASATPIHRVGKTVLDSETLDAKAAFEAERAAITGQKNKTFRDQQIAAVVSEEDFQAILIAWAQKHSVDFHPSHFNLQNLTNILLICLDQGNTEGVTGLNTSSLETVFQWARKQTSPPLFEPQIRRRGEMAARFVEYKPIETTVPLAQKTIQRTVITREENQELRALDFEELRTRAQAGYKSRKPTISDFRG